MSASPVDLHALAQEVARLLRADTTGTNVLTADQVARRFNVARSWVYTHADELGAIRLGTGSRPRLRFDPAVVAQALAASPGGNRRKRRTPAAPCGAPLLPITPSRPRRSLDTEGRP
jgi:hypothetical protein